VRPQSRPALVNQSVHADPRYLHHDFRGDQFAASSRFQRSMTASSELTRSQIGASCLVESSEPSRRERVSLTRVGGESLRGNHGLRFANSEQVSKGYLMRDRPLQGNLTCAPAQLSPPRDPLDNSQAHSRLAVCYTAAFTVAKTRAGS
jgi:hypothetical protein